MNETLSQDALAQLFLAARTYNAWLPRCVTDAQLHQLYELAKLGPTSANSSPMRLVFVKSPEAKARLEPRVYENNRAKTNSAPVTAIVAADYEFYEKLPKLFPHVDAKSWFVGKPSFIDATAFRNSSMQGAYVLLAARSLGLDAGPMSGFDAKGVDQEFFAGTSIRSNFLINLGYGDVTRDFYPRKPRLTFDEAATII